MPLIRHHINNQWVDVKVDDTMPTLTPYEIQARMYQYAEEYSVETWPSEHRNHLGISIIGDECWRKLWYSFRWVKLEQFEGRMRRLFQRGHREEPHFEQFLLWAGINFRSIDPRTDKQYKLSKVNGHYGGSTDGIGIVSWCEDLPIILEFKTHNLKSFTELKEKKVKLAKPQHLDQMSGYGQGFEIKHGLYCAVCKDNDEWYFEFVELDWNRGIELEKKASDIVYAKTPPAKINENPSFYKCKFCSAFRGICHYNEPIEKNCRSCEFASPVDNGEWFCNKFNGNIPKDFIKVGCGDWKGIV